MDWNHIKIFAAVANQGSLSGAARILGMSQPTVGRHIEALEKALNVRLFDRESHGYVLTCAGERLLPQVSAMERAALTIDDIAGGTADRMEGVVRITSPEMASRFFGRRLAALRAELPGIQIEFLTSNKTLNLSRREADIAIRPVMPDHGDLRMKQAYLGQLAVYGCSDYINAHPEALTEERYRSCDWITMKQGHVLNRLDRWIMEGKTHPVKPDPLHIGPHIGRGGPGRGGPGDPVHQTCRGNPGPGPGLTGHHRNGPAVLAGFPCGGAGPAPGPGGLGLAGPHAAEGIFFPLISLNRRTA